MPAFNFQQRFVPGVENGLARIAHAPPVHRDVRQKRQTIRARRKDGRDPKPGDTLKLFTGMRTKQCVKLGETRCRTRQEIQIDIDGLATVDGERLSLGKLAALRRRDGLPESWEFRSFFQRIHGLPFEGYVYRW